MKKKEEEGQEDPFKFERPYPILCPPEASVEEFLAMRLVVSGQMFGDEGLPVG